MTITGSVCSFGRALDLRLQPIRWARIPPRQGVSTLGLASSLW